jgi:hypothetical protein
MVDEYARPRGIAVPQPDLLRKLEREIDGRLVIAKREGADALRKTLPPQQRSVAELQRSSWSTSTATSSTSSCDSPTAASGAR